MPRPLILRENGDGHLVDAQGIRYNAQGQRLDENGVVIPEPAQHANGDQGARDEAPPVQTLADFNRPDRFYANRSAIRPPAFERNDFELKLQYYTVMGQNQFHGLPSENPMDHLERFEDIVGGIKAQGVNKDYLHCKLFPHSLAGEASSWLNTLPPGSLTTWEETKKQFLVYFYDDAKSEELRTQITCFKQGPKESFKSGWIRFKKLQRDCPHHGFSEPQLLSTFFKGVDWRYQVSLDSASNGNFMTRSPAAAEQLIQNLTQSSSTKQCDEERARTGGADLQNINEIRSSLSSIQNMLRKKVSFVDKAEEFENEQERDCNYVGGSGFQGPRSSFQNNFRNSGYTRNYGDNDYQKPAPMKSDDIQGMFEQLLEGQNKLTGSLNGKIDTMYNEFNARFEAMNIHMKKLDTQVAQTAEAMKRQTNHLPGRTEQNLREHCNAVFTRSGKGRPPVIIVDHVTQDLVEIEDMDEDEENEEDSTIFRKQKPLSIDTPVSVDRQSRLGVETQNEQSLMSIDTPPSVDRHPVKTTAISKPTDSERVYIPKVPYPKPPKRSKQEIEDEKCKEILDELKIRIPFFKECKMAPALRKYVKKMVSNVISLDEGVMMITDTCTTMIQNKIPKKMKDPGSFVLSCKIGNQAFEHSLCDSGSSVNIVPLSVAKSWGKLKPANMTLTLADRSVRRAAGILDDVLIQVDDCLIPTDFVVLEYEVEPKDPLILGRPFLATAGAVVDFRHSNVDLHLGDKIMHFKMDSKEKATVDGQTFQVDTIQEFVVEDEEVFDSGEEKQIVQPELTEKSAAPSTVAKKKVPKITLSTPPLKQRYAHPKPSSKLPSIINNNSKGAESVSHLRKPRDYRWKLGFSIDDIAGKRSIPPRDRARPCAIPRFLGQPHAPTAYTPPWMRRLSQKHSMPLFDPPDA